MSHPSPNVLQESLEKPWTIAPLENGQRVISKWRFEMRTDAEKLKAALEKNHPAEKWEVVRVRRRTAASPTLPPEGLNCL